MEDYKFQIGDKVLVNVPQLSVPMYNVPATVSVIQPEIIGGVTVGSLYVLVDDAGEYLGLFHPQWLTLVDGDPWTPVMRSEQEIRSALPRVSNTFQYDTLLWVLGLLPELPEG